MTEQHQHDDRVKTNLKVPSPADVSRADNDVRYVPVSSAPFDFCGLAHESRYAWVCEHWDLSSKTILDFGCGSGYGTDRLASFQTAMVHGVDYSRQAIAFAQSRYKKNNVAFFTADASSAHEVFTFLKRQSYDLITSFDVIEHIEKYRDYLVNIATLIKSDGTLIIGCPNRLQTLSWNRTWNPYHHQEFAPRQFREILMDYFDNVVLMSQDFHDSGKREASRLRNYGTNELLPPMQFALQDIAFTIDPPATVLDQAFGLVAICSRVRKKQACADRKRIKVLLIEPRYGYKNALSWIPIGKGYIAAILRRNGFDVKIIDNAIDSHDDSTLLDLIDYFSPDIIGTGGMTLQMNDTKRIAGLVRRSGVPDALLVGGGVHLTLLPADGLEQFDLIVLGEGEETFLEVCKRFRDTEGSKDRERYADIQGLCYRSDDGIHRTEPRPFIKDLDTLPLPAYDLLDIKKYNDFLINGERAVSVMTGRGCPFDCEFCASPALYQRKVRTFSLEYTFNLIEYLKETFEFTNFRIMDDTFASNKKRALAFCEEIHKRGLNLNLTCLTHVKTADESMFKAMKAAGFTIVVLGIESGNDNILKLINKGITREKAISAIGLAKEAGLMVEGLFMIGNMGETLETIQDTIQFANTYNPVVQDGKRIGFNWFQFAIPFPGSRFFRKANEYGTVVTRNYDDYTHQVPVFVPQGLDAETMIRLREHALRNSGYDRPDAEAAHERSVTRSSSKNQACEAQFGKHEASPRKVIHVGWGHPPNLSAGPIYYLHQLCLEQRLDGLKPVCFVASNEQGDPAGEPIVTQSTIDGIVYHIIGNRPVRYFDWSDPGRETSNPAIESLFIKVLHEVRPDIVHFHNMIGLSMSLPEMAKQQGCITFLSAHNYWMMCPRDDLFAPNEAVCLGPGDGARCASCVGATDRITDFMERTNRAKQLLAGSIDMVIAVSDRVKRIFLAYGVPENKIVVQHIGSTAAVENWRAIGAAKSSWDVVADKPVIFGFFGGVTARKGAHVVLEAAKCLKNRFGQFKVELHGYCPPGEYQNRLNHMMANDVFLQQCVSFKGGYVQRDIPHRSRGVDVAVIPPVWEDNGPQTVIEALGAGLPVIGSNIGGIPDFVTDGKNGLLFRPGDAHDLARAMEAILADRTAIRNMRHEIREPVSMDRHALKLVHIYDQLIAQSPSLPRFVAHVLQPTATAQDRYCDVQKLTAEGRTEEAVRALRKLVEDHKDFAIAHNDLGVLLLNQGDAVQALIHYRKAVELDPDNIIFRKNLADFLYVKMEQPESALIHYDQIISAKPDDIESLLTKGHICISLGHFNEAVSLFDRVLQLDPENAIAVQFLDNLRKPEFIAKAERSPAESDGDGNEGKGRRISGIDSSQGGLRLLTLEASARSEARSDFFPNAFVSVKTSIFDCCQNNSFEIHRVGSFDEYIRYSASMRSVFEERWRIEQNLIGEGESFTVHGICAICNSKVNFHVDYFASPINNDVKRVPNWRERLICPQCGLINRCRAVIHFVQKLLPASAKTSIYIAEQTTPVYHWLSRNYPKIIGSEFLGSEIPIGTRRSDGIRNENLTALTFPDDSFDCVMSFDVFEHIPDYRKALRECWRVLKTDGLLMFTVPFDTNSRHTIIRARHHSDGTLEHIFPPEYHGDPLNRVKGCLCYQVFGWEIIQDLEGIGFDGSSAYFYWSRQLGHLGHNQMIFVAAKKESQKQQSNVTAAYRKTSSQKIEVSIVIPVFNKLSYTKKCLQAINRNSPAGTYEIVVVDNASSDGTSHYLKSLEGPVQVLTNTENIGFTLACNQGARIACGEYILFLNNDTEPMSGWLENLVELAESDSAVGVVGSKLVYPDGKLQEAGGIIFRDGSGWNYGRLGDPDDPAFNYVREVDYVSGASLLIKNSLLKQLNYFDEQYSPGYYEDTDLCFAVRSLGYKVMYCPLSVVVHHEGVSSGNDLNQGMKKYQAINRGKFVAKWAKALCTQYAPDSKNVVFASQRGTKENILVIDPFLPMFDRASGSLRLFHIVSLMKKQGHHLTYIARNGQGQERYADILRKMGVEVYATDPDTLRQMGYNVGARKIDLRSILKSRHYQVAYLSFYSLALQYLFAIRNISPQTKILIDSVDIHFIREQREAELNNDAALSERSMVTREHELFIYSKADAIITVTEQDWNHVKQNLPGKGHFVIPNIHATNGKPLTADGRSGLLFVGNFSHPPNSDAIKYFLKDIFPSVKKALPNITLTIVGNNPPKDILDLGQEGVQITGYVESTEPYIGKARVSVAPLRYGAGMKGKIGEAMAHGLPVVTTSIGAEGMGLVSGETAFISDSPQEFAEHIITLCTRDDTWHSIASAARQMIMDNYSPQKVYVHIEDMLRQAKTMRPLEIPNEAQTQQSKVNKVMQKGLVSIIILTFNQLKFTIECVESIRKHTREAHEIIFIDNGSTDGTTKWLRKVLKNNSHYKLIENKKNLGFSKGCNQGIEASTGEYILFLNNDVVVTENWLAGMLEGLNSALDIGIVGPMTNNISGPQKVPIVEYTSIDGLSAYARAFREKNRHRRIPCKRVVGFCMLFKNQLTEEIGLLDESFGSGNFEDDDWCLRASLAGYQNVITGDVFIHHYGSRTFIGNKIDYGSSLSGNRKIFTEKWGGKEVAQRFGKRISIVNAVVKADQFYRQGDIEKATASLLEAIKHSPDDRGLYFNLIEMLIDAKRYDDALSILESVPQRDTDARQFALLGYCEEGLGHDDKAQVYADRALAIEESMAQALNIKGVVAYKKGARDIAEDLFRKAMESTPEFGESYTNLGALKWAAGEQAEALDLFERGFILSPTVADVITAYHSAVDDTGWFARAEHLFREARALHPNDKRIAFFLIAVLIQSQKQDLAMQEIEYAMNQFGIDDGILKAALEIRAQTGPLEVCPSPTRRSLSVCMIVKNEELNLAKCLMSVKPVADEIIVVDTGSTDKTKLIGSALGAKVFDFTWTNNFSDARNYSLSKASGDWMLVLDADEMISPLDHASLRSLIQQADKRFAYSMTTRNYTHQVASQNWMANEGKYLQEEAGSGWLPSPKVRLFVNDKRIQFVNAVHELVEPTLKDIGIRLKNCSIPVHHYGRLNQDRVLAKGEEYYRLGKKKVLETKGDYKALKELAIQASEIGKFAEALPLWENLLKLNPKDAVAYLNLGYAHIRLSQYDEGLICSQKALELDPNSKEAGLNYAGCELIIGDIKNAIFTLDKLLQKNPDYPPALARIAAAYIIDGQREEGLKCIECLRQLRFDCAGVLSEHARAFFSQNSFEKAIVLLEMAIESKSMNTDTHLLLAECRRKNKNHVPSEVVRSSDVSDRESLPEQHM